jgi:hypothetical protein
MAGKVKTWVWVVVGIVVIGILGVVAMAGVGIYFFSRHIETRVATPASAASEFEAVRTRFKEQKPLIELDDRGRFVRSNPDRPATLDTRPDQLTVLVFDPDDGGRIVRVSIPFWLLRLKLGGATVDFNGGRMDLEDMKLSVEDLERLGPSLIVDHATADGERVLVWSQ